MVPCWPEKLGITDEKRVGVYLCPRVVSNKLFAAFLEASPMYAEDFDGWESKLWILGNVWTNFVSFYSRA
jgi:hypothetical protein